MSKAPIWMSGFGVGFGNRIILDNIDLELPERGLIAIFGPTGVGKSTMLRALCGIAQQCGNFKSWGDYRYQGLMPGEASWPGLVIQDARLFLSTVSENLASGLTNRSQLTSLDQLNLIREQLQCLDCAWLIDRLDSVVIDLTLAQQRVVAILRQTFSQPPVLCVDEPTQGLSGQDADEVLRVLKRCSESCCVLMVSHNQSHVRACADQIILLAGGRIQEMSDAADFFQSPKSEAGKEFLKWGTCTCTKPDAKPEELDESMPAPPAISKPAREAMSHWAGPSGFVWLEKGRLAGTPKPGVFNDLEHDLDALQRVGVTRLLSLLEEPLNVEQSLFDTRNIKVSHLEIKDMRPPTLSQAAWACGQIQNWLKDGEVVAIHCHAGHGRTGTMLAAYRIWIGDSAGDAIDCTRRLERRWIQSQDQVDFLSQFAASIQNRVSGACNGSNGDAIANKADRRK